MPPRWKRRIFLGLAGWAMAFAGLQAHTLTITQVLASFDQPGTVQIKIDVDFTLLLGNSTEAYYQFATGPAPAREQTMVRLLPDLLDSIQFFVGDEPLKPILQGMTLPTASKADFDDASISKLTTLQLLAILPASGKPLHLSVPIGARVDFPIAFTVQIPSAHVSVTRWLEPGMHESDLVAWAADAPKAGLVAAANLAPVNPGPTTTATPVAAPVVGKASAMQDAVDSLPWYRQLTMYLRLGFGHIVPGGLDHILFVLGLFFLGLTWRKLLSQTTVFTVAHATTLFLSTYGVVRLPRSYVEPAIALTISFIALENIVRPKLGVWRLVLVFAFGLIHGLGFANSLSEIPFPRHQFIMALLGFNFGVDLGQLFVIALAFFAVGSFRQRPWFRARIAVPCSLVIALIGLVWAVQRIVYFSHH